MTVKPYALLSCGFLRRLQDALQSCLAEWGQEWGVGGAALQVECVRACEADAGDVAWLLAMCDAVGRPCLWLARGDDAKTGLQQLIFPEKSGLSHPIRRDGTIAEDVSEKAMSALLSKLSARLSLYLVAAGPSEEPPESWQFVRASGAAVARIKLANFALSLLLSHQATEALRSLARPEPPLARVRWSEALTEVPVSLIVSAGGAVATAADFATLAPGDVLRLAASVDEPLWVSGPDGQKLFLGNLGLQGRMMAIEAVRS